MIDEKKAQTLKVIKLSLKGLARQGVFPQSDMDEFQAALDSAIEHFSSDGISPEEYQWLEHELDAVKDARPEPCTKFHDASRKEWIAKLNEEVSEVIESLCSPAISREDRLREMVDVATVARSMAYATGYTLGEWEEMQRWVNDHNRRRGYMDEPVR